MNLFIVHPSTPTSGTGSLFRRTCDPLPRPDKRWSSGADAAGLVRIKFGGESAWQPPTPSWWICLLSRNVHCLWWNRWMDGCSDLLPQLFRHSLTQSIAVSSNFEMFQHQNTTFQMVALALLILSLSLVGADMPMEKCPRSQEECIPRIGKSEYFGWRLQFWPYIYWNSLLSRGRYRKKRQ